MAPKTDIQITIVWSYDQPLTWAKARSSLKFTVFLFETFLIWSTARFSFRLTSFLNFNKWFTWPNVKSAHLPYLMLAGETLLFSPVFDKTFSWNKLNTEFHIPSNWTYHCKTRFNLDPTRFTFQEKLTKNIFKIYFHINACFSQKHPGNITDD